jgi:outer membrane biosynthesis protein TonB
LADYRQAEEFSHFGSELAAEAKRALEVGKRLFQMMTQSPTDTYSLMAQQLMLDIVLHADTNVPLDVSNLKLNAPEFAAKVTGDDVYDQIRDQLKAKCTPEPPKAPEPAPAAPPTDPANESKQEKKDRKKEEKEEAKKEKEDVKAAEEAKKAETAEVKT